MMDGVLEGKNKKVGRQIKHGLYTAKRQLYERGNFHNYYNRMQRYERRRLAAMKESKTCLRRELKHNWE